MSKVCILIFVFKAPGKVLCMNPSEKAHSMLKFEFHFNGLHTVQSSMDDLCHELGTDDLTWR